MTKDEVLKMAIEALEQAHSLAFKEIAGSPPDEVLFEDALIACKEALEQPAQEPVAWINYVWKPYEEESDDDGFYPDVDLDTYDNGGEPLYTHPCVLTHPAPSWQGLSDDEIQEELKKMWDKGIIPSYSIVAFARAIEQASRIKNGY